MLAVELRTEKVAAWRRMRLARVSSRFLASSSRIRCRSLTCSPGSSAAALLERARTGTTVPDAAASAHRTHPRSASGWMSSWPAIRTIAPRLVLASRRASITRRVARSFNSSGYFRDAGMVQILRVISLRETRGGSQPVGATP